MSQPFSILVISDEYDSANSPVQQKAATTRLMARVAEHLRTHENVNVSYHNVREDYDALMSYRADAPTVALLIRSQYNEMLDVAQSLTARDVPVFFHLADAHVKNPDPQMAKRVSLHDELLRLSAGVIASSPANKEVGLEYNRNTHYIPDPMDAEIIRPPVPPAGFRLDGADYNWFSSGYPIHHASFAKAAAVFDNIKGVAHDVMHLYYVCTSDKQQTEKNTHASQSGADYFASLKKIAEKRDSCLALVEPFSAFNLDFYLRNCDVVLIPSDPLEELTAFQKIWFPKKGDVRVVAGLAYGKLVAVEEPYPLSYAPFVEAGAIITASDMPNLIDRVINTNQKDAIAAIVAGQQIIREKYTPEVVATQHLKLYKQALGLK